jgi:hypothetical protein
MLWTHFAKDGRTLVEERPRGSRSHEPRLTWTEDAGNLAVALTSVQEAR